ncbi:MAG: VOC family protein [Syntrophomonadaceae bacterium]|nr:VOC family protein [Syntrophomonadaceae bacterium]MDD3889918.1 VOC family protein [Syntrophomonadaceae bacterium]MDD4550119.1 VOC family protein [Syntrophomonadaceae bacterium]
MNCKFDHTSIIVKDCDKSAQFYTNAFGFKISGIYENKHLKIISLDIDGVTLELLQYTHDTIPDRHTGICDHIALQVDNLDQWILKLKEISVEFLFDKPQTLLNNKKIIFLLGPDGERIELVENA